MRRKVVGMLIATMLVMCSLIGCGQASSEDKQLEQETEVTADTSEKGECEITYFTWSESADGNFPQNMLDAFHAKYPWITVKCEIGSQSQGEYVKSQKERFDLGEDIDVTTLYPNTYKEFVEDGYLENISGEAFFSNYADSFVEAVTLNGKMYAIPYTLDAIGVMYNIDMFEEHGWEVPTNKAEWLALCEQISSEGIIPMVNGAMDSWPLAHEAYPFMQRLYIDNPTIFEDIKLGNAKYTDEPFVKTFDEISEYFATDAVSEDAMEMSFSQANGAFAKGMAAMVCHGEWAQGSVLDVAPDMNIGVFQIPYNEPGETQIGAVEVGQLQAISASSKNKEAAKLLVEYMSSEEAAVLLAETLGNFPAVAGVEKPGYEAWQPILEAESIPFYYDQMSSGASAEFFNQLQAMYTQKTTTKEALEAIQDAQVKMWQP